MLLFSSRAMFPFNRRLYWLSKRDSCLLFVPGVVPALALNGDCFMFDSPDVSDIKSCCSIRILISLPIGLSVHVLCSILKQTLQDFSFIICFQHFLLIKLWNFTRLNKECLSKIKYRFYLLQWCVQLTVSWVCEIFVI